MPAEIVFGLLEDLLIPLQHPTLLSMGLEELGQVLAQTGLGRGGFLELHRQGPTVGRRVSRPPAGRAGRGAVGWGTLAAGVLGAAGWAGNTGFSSGCSPPSE